MIFAANKILKNSYSLLRTLRDRSIERDFQKIDFFKCGPAGRLSDFVLMRGYRVLIEEIENEANSDIKYILFNDLLEIETELKKRNLINEAFFV